jgi:hypothetical protein
MAYGIEDGIKYTFFKDLKDRTVEMGYSSIKEAIITEYEKLGGANPVGKKLKLCGSTINNKLKMFKHPIKPRGGANNPLGNNHLTKKVKQ